MPADNSLASLMPEKAAIRRERRTVALIALVRVGKALLH